MIDLLPSSPAWVALDTETSGLHPDDGARVACVALTWPETPDDPYSLDEPVFKTLGLPFDQGVRDKLPTTQLDFDFSGGGGRDPNLGGEEWRALLEWLRDKALVFHNAKFDLAMMRVGTRHWPGIDLVDNFTWDTMLAQRVLDPLERAALDATARRLDLGYKKGLDVLKDWLKRNKFPPNRYDLAPWSIVETYVTADTEMTARLYDHQRDRLQGESPDVEARITRELDVTVALYKMEERGIQYDDVASLEAADKLDGMADEIEKGMPFKCTPSEAHAYFYGTLKLDPAMRKKKINGVHQMTEAYTLDEEQVRGWKKDGVPWAAEFSQVMKYRKAVSMWYRGYPEKIGMDGRLRTTFRQGHVKSGRMSVERVQLQAMPKTDKDIEGIPGVRRLISAKEGHGLWNLDLSQAELRVAAHYARCKLMQEMLAKGIDLHGETTKQVIGVEPDDPEWKIKRDIAKRLNFSGIFQVGPETFQATLSKLADIHLPIRECSDIVYGWRRMYPEFSAAYQKADRKVSTDGYVRLLPNTPYEIKSWFGERDYANTAWNRMVQGSLAEVFKIWLGEIEARWPGHMVLTIHDSVVNESPLDEGEQVAQEMADFGAELFSNLFGTTMKVDVDRW